MGSAAKYTPFFFNFFTPTRTLWHAICNIIVRNQ